MDFQSTRKPLPSSLGALDADRASAIRGLPLVGGPLNHFRYWKNPLFSEGRPEDPDAKGIHRLTVLRLAEDDYRMWYGGIASNGCRSLCLARSRDGLSWRKSRRNPVARPDRDWESNQIAPTSVVYVNGLFHLYYWSPGHFAPPKEKRIGLMTSSNGVDWEKRGPVLEAEPEILNESPRSGGSGVDAARVFYFEETGKWSMIFVGFGPHATWNGLAESSDGFHWRKLKAPLIPLEGKQDIGECLPHGKVGVLRAPCRVGSIWVALYYTGGEGNGREYSPAISPNLADWTVFGKRILWANQDGEEAISVDDVACVGDWYYVYCVCKENGVGRPGVLRAPKRSSKQGTSLWEEGRVPKQGHLLSGNYEMSQDSFDLYLSVTQPMELELLIQEPLRERWHVFKQWKIATGSLCRICESGKFFRFKFRISASNGGKVSAWMHL